MSRRKSLYGGVAAVLITVQTAILVHSATVHSPTWDEIELNGRDSLDDFFLARLAVIPIAWLGGLFCWLSAGDLSGQAAVVSLVQRGDSLRESTCTRLFSATVSVRDPTSVVDPPASVSVFSISLLHRLRFIVNVSKGN